MPTLPTFEVTQAQADRIQAAFGSIANYRAWLKQAIKDYVFNHESEQITQGVADSINAKRAEIDNDLDVT